MTQFAQYDPTLSPAPVTAWWDTGEFDYPNMPQPGMAALELTEDQWNEHFETASGWAVENGKLVPFTRPPPEVVPPAAM